MERLTDTELEMLHDLSGEGTGMRRMAVELIERRKSASLIAAYRDDLAGRATTPGPGHDATEIEEYRRWIAGQIAACNRVLGVAP